MKNENEPESGSPLIVPSDPLAAWGERLSEFQNRHNAERLAPDVRLVEALGWMLEELLERQRDLETRLGPLLDLFDDLKENPGNLSAFAALTNLTKGFTNAKK